MKKSKMKIAIATLLALTISSGNFTFNNVTIQNVIAQEDGYDVPTLTIVDENGQPVTEELEFKFTNHNDESDFRTVKTKAGKIEGFKLKTEDSYTVTLVGNSKYETEVTNDFCLMFGVDDTLTVTKKGSTPVVPNDDETNKTYDDIPVINAKDDKAVTETVTFSLYDITDSKQEPKFVKKISVENGIVSGLKLELERMYKLKLDENEKFVMSDIHFCFNKSYNRPIVPLNMEGSIYVLDKILLDEKTADETNRYTVYLPVLCDNVAVKNGVTFKFVTASEILTATTKDGCIRVRVKDNLTYMVQVEDEKYDIITFPLTIKEKDLVGKLPYDYRNCEPLDHFDLKLKNTIPDFPVKENSDGSISVSGMNFAELLLVTNKVENKNPNLLNKDVTIYDIIFKNTVRDEIVDLVGDFTVKVKKDAGKNVVNVYHIKDDGSLENMQIISQDENFVTFKTTHFSEYALEYGKNRNITGDELLEAQKNGAVIIDVRVNTQYNAGHIEGAINIPLEVIEKQISKYPKDTKIVLYCNSGNRSGQALKKLLDLGYTEVYNAPGVRQYDYKLVTETVVNIPDKNLKKAINMALGSGRKADQDVTVTEMEKLTKLGDEYTPLYYITDITGLEHAKNLKLLNLDENAISNIEPLKNLTKLEFLHLAGANISDISALSELVNLKDLNLAGNFNTEDITAINSLSPLEKLTNLEILSIAKRGLTDISALKNLKALNQLYLSENSIENIDSLKELTNLESIDLSFNKKIKNIDSLKNLKNLSNLILTDNSIEDISSLSDLTSLTTLHLNVNKISNIDSLAKLTALDTLYLNSNNISNIEVVKNLTNLKKLRATDNKIVDISSLQNLTKLNDLNLSNNRIYDFSPIKDLPDRIKNRGYAKQLFSLKIKNGEIKLPVVKNNNGEVVEFDKNPDGSIKLYKTVVKGRTQILMTEVDGREQPVELEGAKGLVLGENGNYKLPEGVTAPVAIHWINMKNGEKDYQQWGAISLLAKAENENNNNGDCDECSGGSQVVPSNNDTASVDKASWQKIDGTWYYRDSANKDIYKDAWGKIDNVWYRFDKDGKMLSNTWFKDTNGRWYWLESSGAMSENEWIYVDGNWFWAYGNGIIAENEWVYVGDKWYYAKAGGYIVMNQDYTVNGVVYSFDENGAMK